MQSNDDSRTDPRIDPRIDPRTRDLPPIPYSNIECDFQQENVNRLTDEQQNYSLMNLSEDLYLLPISVNKDSISQPPTYHHEVSQCSFSPRKSSLPVSTTQTQTVISEKPFDIHKPSTTSNSPSSTYPKPIITGLKPSILKTGNK